MKLDTSFLHYFSPLEYRRNLGGESDPKSEANHDLRDIVKEYLRKAPLKEYVQFSIITFKDRHPNIYFYYSCIYDAIPSNAFSIEGSINRSTNDVAEIIIERDDYFDPTSDDSVEIEGHLILWHSSFYPSVTFKFTEAQKELSAWIEEALDGKSFSKQGGDTYLVSDSPISKITYGDTEITMYLTKESYRSYY